MKTILSVTMLLALLLPLSLQATDQNAHAFDGTWKVDVSQAKTAGKPQVIALKDGQYSCDCTPPIRIPADGMDHPVTGHTRFDAVAVRVVDDHTVTETSKMAGKVVYEQTVTVAADGKTASFAATSMANGEAATVKGTMTRQAPGSPGSHAVAGSWLTTGYQSASENMMSYVYRVDGQTVSMHDMRGESYTATLDGKPAPYKGEPGTDMVAVKMVGGALQETMMYKGKETSVTKMTVSPDGKTMTTVITYKPSNRDLTLVAMKQ